MSEGRYKILTMVEVAEYLKASVKTVRRRIASGKLKAFKDGGRLLVLASDLEEYVQSQIDRRVNQ